jgi:tetratricopeptide (TPR) repeat protein
MILPVKFFSQQFDEKLFLKTLPKAKNDTNKVNALNFYGSYLIKKGDSEKAIFYCDSSAKMAKRLKYEKGEMEAYANLSQVCHNNKEWEKELSWERKKLEKFAQSKNWAGIAGCHHSMGLAFIELGKADSAIFYERKALNEFKHYGNKQGMASAGSSVGSLYLQKKEYGKALEYSKDASRLLEELNDKKALFDVYKNLAEIYGEIGNTIEQKNYESKFKTLEKEFTAINNAEASGK